MSSALKVTPSQNISRSSTFSKSDSVQTGVGHHQEKLMAVRHWNYDNAHVKCPFKQFQRVQTHAPKPRTRSTYTAPDQLLILQTAEATCFAAQSAGLSSQTALKPDSSASGRRLKGRVVLRPVNYVKLDGPSIDHCRGIVSGTRPQANSRSLARRKAIVSMMSQNIE